jgi:hypothetical protein
MSYVQPLQSNVPWKLLLRLGRATLILQAIAFIVTLLLISFVNQGTHPFGFRIPIIFSFSHDIEANGAAMNYLSRRGGNILAWAIQILFALHCLIFLVELIIRRVPWKGLFWPALAWLSNLLIFIIGYVVLAGPIE